eukprot:3159248-Prymnesium_polylepis.1
MAVAGLVLHALHLVADERPEARVLAALGKVGTLPLRDRTGGNEGEESEQTGMHHAMCLGGGLP